jgi:hypothetical protein
VAGVGAGVSACIVTFVGEKKGFFDEIKDINTQPVKKF